MTLLEAVRSAQAARHNEKRLLVQAQINQNTFVALVAAHQSLATGHRQGILAHRQTAEALEESEARFLALYERSPLGIALIDLAGRLIESNAALQKFLGYNREELAAMTIDQVTYLQDAETACTLFQELLTGQRNNYQLEKQYLRKDGTVVWGHLTVSLIYTPQQTPLFAIVMLENITTRMLAARALYESDARKTAILEVALDAIITINHADQIVEWNTAAERILGYSRADAVGRELAELIIPPRLRERCRNGLARAYLTSEMPHVGHRFESTCLRSDGSEFPVEITITRIVTQGQILFTGYVRDITERRRSEEALRFLAASSRTLAMTLDYDTTLAQVARIAVPFLADFCAIDVLSEDRSVCRQALAHVDPAQEEILRMLQNHSPLDPHRLHQFVRVLETKQPEIIADITEELLEGLEPDEEQRSILHNLKFRSAMIVPLIAHGRTLGTLILATSESRRVYEPEDLVLAQGLAVNVAYAIENGRLYQEAR